VLQNVRVLAIDQTADERNDKPSVVRAVTLEVDTASAQKLALAASIGTLSLILRKAGDAAADTTRPITLSDLTGGEVVAPAQESVPLLATIKVYRPTKDAQKYSREDYSVPAEDAAISTVGRRRAVQ